MYSLTHMWSSIIKNIGVLLNFWNKLGMKKKIRNCVCLYMINEWKLAFGEFGMKMWCLYHLTRLTNKFGIYIYSFYFIILLVIYQEFNIKMCYLVKCIISISIPLGLKSWILFVFKVDGRCMEHATWSHEFLSLFNLL